MLEYVTMRVTLKKGWMYPYDPLSGCLLDLRIRISNGMGVGKRKIFTLILWLY